MSPDDKRYVLPDDILTASGFTCARCADPECRCIHFIFEDAEGKPILHAIISPRKLHETLDWWDESMSDTIELTVRFHHDTVPLSTWRGAISVSLEKSSGLTEADRVWIPKSEIKTMPDEKIEAGEIITITIGRSLAAELGLARMRHGMRSPRRQ